MFEGKEDISIFVVQKVRGGGTVSTCKMCHRNLGLLKGTSRGGGTQTKLTSNNFTPTFLRGSNNY